jgi:hypothetical protein
MKRPVLLYLIVALGAAPALAGLPEKGGQHPVWDGNRTVPSHIIQLKDEFDQLILPSDGYALPFSARTTCGPCHEYASISEGFHFNAGSMAPAGRAGEPWIWLDEKTGTILPLSYRPLKGRWFPDELGLSFWDFTHLFGRHMPGGGVGEPSLQKRYPDSRWDVSGLLEINCLACHSGFPYQSHSEWAKQILRENFRWAATAASGLGEVGGMASRLPPTWDIFDGPNPDDSEWAVVPSVKYSAGPFDSKHRVLFPLAEKPADSRCLSCHSASPAGAKKHLIEEDVHSAAGLSCTDCHRGDLSHTIIRGYEGEEGLERAEEFTCAGCHLGDHSSPAHREAAGRLGAPYPRHKGFPPIHFEKLACTVCHSGPQPAAPPTRMRLSRVHRLGIYGAARWDRDLPAVLAPVYTRESTGKLTPQRLIWPAFWGLKMGIRIQPLPPDVMLELSEGILDAEERISALLGRISQTTDLAGLPALGIGEKLYTPNADGGLDVETLIEGAKTDGRRWLVRTSTGLSDLVPAFDPDLSEGDPDEEIRIQALLEILSGWEGAPGEPAVVRKNSLYRLVEGYLDKADKPEDIPQSPGLIWIREGRAIPFISDFQVRTITSTVGREETLTEEQVVLMLKALGNPEEEGGEYVYVASGRMFRLKGEDLAAEDHADAGPVLWAMAHQVRPASRSLGIRSCKDCHSAESEFFFSPVAGTGPLITSAGKMRSAASFMDLGRPYQKLFGLSFTVRPLFKWLLFGCLAVLGALLGLALMMALGRAAGLIPKRR